MAKASKPKTAAPTQKVVRSTAAVAANAQANPKTAMFQVLEPFWLGGAVVKPDAFVEMTAAEAQRYQDAGVLGTEPGEVPTDADPQ